MIPSAWHTDSLADLQALIWATLSRALADIHHPWSLPSLGTSSEDGPEVRTVVLREVDPAWRRLVAYSDARAAKVAEVRADPRVTWHFYDPRQRVQLRARGAAVVEQGTDYARGVWLQVPEANRAHYRTMGPPGMVIAAPAEGHIFAPGDADHFAVLVTTIQELDWLWLAHEGHRRAKFVWREADGWQGSWTVP